MSDPNSYREFLTFDEVKDAAAALEEIVRRAVGEAGGRIGDVRIKPAKLILVTRDDGILEMHVPLLDADADASRPTVAKVYAEAPSVPRILERHEFEISAQGDGFKNAKIRYERFDLRLVNEEFIGKAAELLCVVLKSTGGKIDISHLDGVEEVDSLPEKPPTPPVSKAVN